MDADDTGYMSWHRAVQFKFESIWFEHLWLQIFETRNREFLVAKGFMYLSCQCHTWSVPQRLHLTVWGMPWLPAKLAVSRSCFRKVHSFLAQLFSYILLLWHVWTLKSFEDAWFFDTHKILSILFSIQLCFWFCMIFQCRISHEVTPQLVSLPASQAQVQPDWKTEWKSLKDAA